MKYRKGEYILVANKSALEKLKPTTQCLWMWLCAYADGYGQCWPSRTRLAMNLHISVRTVDRQIALLEQMGWIEKTTRYKAKKQQSNLYQLNLVGGATKTTPPPKQGRQKRQLGATKTTHRTKPITNKEKLLEVRSKLIESGVLK